MSLFNTSTRPRSQEVAASRSENGTRDVEPTVAPRYDIHETDDAYGVTVFLPGVSKDNLEITAEAGEFRILGRRTWSQTETWTALYRESADLPYGLTLNHDNAINADKISAELRDGVLRVSLPKAEALKPRKITVG